MKERKYKEDYALEQYIDERGKEKRRAVYRGKWYRLRADAAEKKKLQLVSVLTCVAFAAVYLFYMKLSTPSAWCMYVLPVCAAGLIPLLYWAMGLFAMLRAPEKMTSIDKENGIGRVMRSAMGCMILMGTACVGDIIFMARSGNFTAEWPGFMLILCACIIALAGFRYVKDFYNHIQVLDNPKGGDQA